jgi:hypothetical protein
MKRNLITAIRTLLTVALLSMPSYAAETAKVGGLAPDFDLSDQYDQPLKLSKLLGDVVLLIYADREGSEFNVQWSRALKQKYPADSTSRVKVVRIANLRSLPTLFRGIAKGRFSAPNDDGTSKISVLLDWQGDIARLYGFREGLPNLYLIDRRGVLQHAVAGKGEGGELAQLFQAIDRLLGTK